MKALLAALLLSTTAVAQVPNLPQTPSGNVPGVEDKSAPKAQEPAHRVEDGVLPHATYTIPRHWVYVGSTTDGTIDGYIDTRSIRRGIQDPNTLTNFSDHVLSVWAEGRHHEGDTSAYDTSDMKLYVNCVTQQVANAQTVMYQRGKAVKRYEEERRSDWTPATGLVGLMARAACSYSENRR